MDLKVYKRKEVKIKHQIIHSDIRIHSHRLVSNSTKLATCKQLVLNLFTSHGNRILCRSSHLHANSEEQLQLRNNIQKS